MAAPPPLPSAVNCLTPAIDSLVANNPARLEHINYGVGRWSDVLAGWKAQATLNLRRVTDEMMQSRLPLASKLGLRALAASKFFANIVDSPTKAIGQIVIQDTKGDGSIGTIPAGTRFRRNANPRAFPLPLAAADFVSLVDIKAVADGVTQYSIPFQCVSTGVAGNIAVEHGLAALGLALNGSDIKIVDQLFSTFIVISATCAGGGTTFSDDEVRAIAGAQPQGRRGPTEGAIYAGSFLATGVRHVAVFEDLVNANTILYVADESWGSDTNYWQPAVIQALLDEWAGFGCSLNPTGSGLVDNIYLNINSTVQLRSSQLLASTADIRSAINTKLQDYFSNRPDWYTFRTKAIRGLIARADPRILTCTAITITDRFGVTIADPSVITAPPTILSHYTLLSSTPTFVAPI